jgi:hypothetical protein
MCASENIVHSKIARTQHKLTSTTSKWCRWKGDKVHDKDQQIDNKRQIWEDGSRVKGGLRWREKLW